MSDVAVTLLYIYIYFYQLIVLQIRGKSKTNIKASFIINGNLVKDKREISNGFNLFFSSIARNMNGKLNSSRLVGDATDEKLLDSISFKN